MSVKIRNSKCASVTSSGSSITCTLDVPVAAGSWDVQVTDVNGLTPKNAAVAAISVPLTISSVSPNSGLNQLGGDILTITGTGFDQVTNTTSIVFGDGTNCTVQTTSATQVTCEVDGFLTSTLDTSNPYSMNITVNGVSDTTQSVTLLTTKQSGVTVSPSSVSPVIASNLTVTLEPTYPETLNKADFSAKLVNVTDASDTRPLYIMSVNDTEKTIKIKFPGADSGSYLVQVTSSSIGRIDKENLAITVESKITGVSPLSGSNLGGTLVTIDGTNFSEDPLDNPVKIGNNYCYVQNSTATRITCRVAERTVADLGEHEVIVFLRTSEEAKVDTPFMYTYASPVSTVTMLASAFDETSLAEVITLSGTSFPSGNLAGVNLYMDNLLQETLTVTDTSATFKVVNALNQTSSNIRIYFADGLATYWDGRTSLSMLPKLVSISPSTGSSGGELITVTGTGFGNNTANLNLIIETTGEEICQNVTILGYGQFTCLTKQMQI